MNHHSDLKYIPTNGEVPAHHHSSTIKSEDDLKKSIHNNNTALKPIQDDRSKSSLTSSLPAPLFRDASTNNYPALLQRNENDQPYQLSSYPSAGLPDRPVVARLAQSHFGSLVLADPLPAMRPFDRPHSTNNGSTTSALSPSTGNPNAASGFPSAPPPNYHPAAYSLSSRPRQLSADPLRPQWSQPPPMLMSSKVPTIASSIPSVARPSSGVSSHVASPAAVNLDGPHQNHHVIYSSYPDESHSAIPMPLPGDMPPSRSAVNSAVADRIRLRVNKACERCRGHKVKCSGSQPCTNCSKHNVQCVFRTSTGAPANYSMSSTNISDSTENQPAAANPVHLQDEGPSAKKPRSSPEPQLAAPTSSATVFPQVAVPPSAPIQANPLPVVEVRASDLSYTSYLENRVQYLENLLSNTPSLSSSSAGELKADGTATEELPHCSSKWRSCARHQNVLVIELCKFLYEGLPPESREAVKVPRAQYFGWNLSGCNYLKPNPLPPMVDITVLSEESRSHYMDFFFREVNPLYAIIHEAVFREQVQAYFKQSKPNGEPTNVTALFLAMLCLVYVLGIRFTEFMNPKGPSMELLRIEEKLFKYSHHVILLFSFEYESFELIQCWLLITLYLRISHRQTSSNTALGQAATMCRAMGLYRHTATASSVSRYDILKAKRIFFAVYSFDRLIGLLGGGTRALHQDDTTREFPGYDFVSESRDDEWVTLPSFAMLRIAMVANYLRTDGSDYYDVLKAQKINKEIQILETWLNENGFDDERNIFPADANRNDGSSDMVKAVVKLHFYDLLFSVHGKLLFSYFGNKVAAQGMQVEKVLQANEGVIYLLKKLDANGCLYAPWYVNLLLLFNVGVNCAILIYRGIYLNESRRLMKEAMQLLQKFQDSPVRGDDDRFIFKERFKMVGECIWVLKMTNKMMALSYKKQLDDIEELGTDPGSNDVNRQYFTQFGKVGRENKDELEMLMENPSRKQQNPPQDTPLDAPTVVPQPASSEFGGNDFLGNLQWFDQWLDFDQNL